MSRILHLPNYIDRDLHSRMYYSITDIIRVDPALVEILTECINHLKDQLGGHEQVPIKNEQNIRRRVIQLSSNIYRDCESIHKITCKVSNRLT